MSLMTPRPALRFDDKKEETPSASPEDYASFKAAFKKKSSIDLNLYKDQQMQRRLYNLVERANLKTFMQYFALMEADAGIYAGFLDRMTINVSELYRNPEKWRELRETILPPMLAENRPLKIWSAGCSYGAEPYSLAILLDQMTPKVCHTIHATDLDRKILEKAKAGLFSAADVRNLTPQERGRYFTPLPVPPNAMPLADAMPSLVVKPEIRQRVQFRPQNLLADRFESDYDLICCRNVVIYFTEEAKDALYVRFHAALRPGGTLLVGGAERIFSHREIGFDSPLPFFYRKCQASSAGAMPVFQPAQSVSG